MPLVLVIFLLVTLVQLRSRARSLLEQGFWYEDVRAAFVDEMRERERAADALRQLPRPAPGMAGILGVLLGVALVVGGLVLGIPSQHGSWQNHLARVMLLSGAPIAMIVALTTFSQRLRVGSRYSALTTRLWLGSFGRVLFRSASRGAEADPAVQLTRSVAASRSLAGLIAALEPADQGQLGETRRVVAQLEQGMRELERRERQIDDALVDAQRGVSSTVTGAAMRAAREALVTDLNAARSALAKRRQLMAGALEAFRLALIRMRAGIGDASTLRTQLESANRLLAEDDSGLVRSPDGADGRQPTGGI
jgi:hypothetical protein